MLSWNTLRLPKWQGGLEIRKAVLMNQAPLAKQYLWFITAPSLLITEVMKVKYFPNTELVERSNHKWLLDLEKYSVRLVFAFYTSQMKCGIRYFHNSFSLCLVNRLASNSYPL